MKFNFVVVSPVSLLFLGIVYSQPPNPQPVSSPPPRKDAGRQSRAFHSNSNDFFSCIVCEVATSRHKECINDSHASHRISSNGFSMDKSLLKEHSEYSLYALQCNVSRSRKLYIRCEQSSIKCKNLLYYKFPSIENGRLHKSNDSENLYLECNGGYELVVNNALIVCTKDACSAEKVLCKAMNFELCKSLIIAVVSSSLILIILMVMVAICVQRIKRTEDQVPTWRRKMLDRKKKHSSEVEEKVYKELIEVPRRSFRFPFYLPKGRPTGKKPMPLQEDGQLILDESSENDGTAVVREGTQSNNFEMMAVVSEQVGRREKRETLRRKVIAELQQKLARCSFGFNSRAGSRKKTIRSTRYPEEEYAHKKNQKTRNRLSFKGMMKQKKPEELQEGSSNRHNVHPATSMTQILTPRDESSRDYQHTYSTDCNDKRVCESSLSSNLNSQFKPKSSISMGSENDKGSLTTTSDTDDDTEDPCYVQLNDILVHKEPADFQNSHLANKSFASSSVNDRVLKCTTQQQIYEDKFQQGSSDQYNVCASMSCTQMPPKHESSKDLQNTRSPEGEKEKLCKSSQNCRKKQQFKPNYSMSSETPKQSRNVNDNHHASDSESIDFPEGPYYLQLSDIVVHQESADNEIEESLDGNYENLT